MDKNICPYIQRTNLYSVEHVEIFNRQITNNGIHYFPNAIELTIKEDFQTSNYLFSPCINSILPLKQLTKLIFDCYYFPFEELISLLFLTPNLSTLKYSFFYFDDKYFKLIKRDQLFRNVSTKNQIKYLNLHGICTLEILKLMMDLFPRVQYLRIQIKRKEIKEIIRFLLSKTNHLFFLCISKIPKICLRELNTLIKSENLFEHYFIKFVNRDLYLWW